MEVNVLSVVLGGMIAGLVGFACFRLEGWRNAQRGRKLLASALEADLRSSVELYDEIASAWMSHKIILFDLLDQLSFVRSNYAIDRPHLGVLGDESIRNRLNLYFRKSYVTLNRLREKQEDIYRANSDEVKAKLVDELSDMMETLEDQRVDAADIADKLATRFT